MKQRSPVSFISLSAFLHGAAFLGLAILPALNLMPLDKAQDAIEMTEISNPEDAAPETQAALPVAPKPVAEAPRPVVVPPRPLFVKKSTPKAPPAEIIQKKIIAIDETKSEDDLNLAKAQEESEQFAKDQEDKFVPAPETTEPIKSADEEIVQDTIQSATSEALAKQAKDEINQMPAPKVNVVAEKLGDIKSEQSSTGSIELDGMAGPTADDLRSYLDLKQASGNRAPLYPTSARRSGWQGEVVLNYYVTADGNVINVRIARSSGFEALDKEAVRAISRYRFVKGQEGWASHPVVFSLKNSAQNGSASSSNFASRSAENSETKE